MENEAYRKGFLRLLRSTNREDVTLAFEIAQGMPDLQPLIEAYQPLGRVSGIVSNNGEIIPAQVLALNRREELSVGTIAHLPEIIWELQRLRKLTIHNMPLKNLPDGIIKLKNLEWLCLFNAPVECFSGNLARLTNLRKLEIIASVQEFPKQVCQLKELILRKNKITHLPDEISSLDNLEMLEISGHLLLKNLPSEIGKLTTLAYLDVSENSLTDLPIEIGQLSQLTYLSATNTDLRHLPPTLKQLKKLEKLDIINTPVPEQEVECLKKDLPSCVIRY
ncbi:MAG TPA: hypothetical protein DCS93_02405 [Microscillaceae bacterium]|nr:hypothetical protein [Microscillaceae bacterium]